MKTKIKINTPPNCADQTAKWLKPFLFKWRRNVKYETEINKDRSQLIWTVEASPAVIYALNSQVAMFDTWIKKALENKIAQRQIKKMSVEDQKLLDDMLRQHTTVKVIKLELD